MPASVHSSADRFPVIDQDEQLDDVQQREVRSAPPSPAHGVHPTLTDGHSQSSRAPLPDVIYDQHGTAWDPLLPLDGGLPIYQPEPEAPPSILSDFEESSSPDSLLVPSSDSPPDDVDMDDDFSDPAVMMGLVILAMIESTMASPAYQIFAARPTSDRGLSRCPYRRSANAWTRTA